jgi:hypothetical protein
MLVDHPEGERNVRENTERLRLHFIASDSFSEVKWF